MHHADQGHAALQHYAALKELSETILGSPPQTALYWCQLVLYQLLHDSKSSRSQT